MNELLLSLTKKAASGGGPGPSTLTAGDAANGLFGSVPSDSFFTGSELATAVGAGAMGTLINDTTPWFKLSKDGQVIFIPQKSIRTGLTWNMIEALGIRTVAHNKIVTKGGHNYRVRLMTGTGSGWAGQLGDDPAGCSDSEYNRFIYRLCALNPPSETPPVLGAYTLAELGLTLASNGCCIICQEGLSSTYIQRNGGSEAANNGTGWSSLQNGVNSNLGDQYRGWRPVLELIE